MSTPGIRYILAAAGFAAMVFMIIWISVTILLKVVGAEAPQTIAQVLYATEHPDKSRR